MKKYILIAECYGNTLYYYGTEDINTFEDENTLFD
jgi:hypothetical protein